MSKKLGSNYWKLWTASVASNFGDGVAMVAYPWLASLVTRDGFKLGLVVVAGRLPWLLFSLPAGVITDRFDRRKLIVAMDLFRSLLTFGVIFLVLANQSDLVVSGLFPLPNENLLLFALIAATFLFGMAEVLRDNSAQTLMPSIVDKAQLERANGRLWGAELVMNQFVGPPVGGLLIAMALVIPFVVHTGTFMISALILITLVGTFRAPEREGPRPTFGADLKEGFKWLWAHPLLKPLAITLGIVNASAMMAQTTFVFFAQDVLQLEPARFGLLLTAGALGGLAGSLGAPKVASKFSKGVALFMAMIVFAATQVVTGLAGSAVLVWFMFLVGAFFVAVWNVITVSLRQRIIPDGLLGRVNSVYRFFGWGMMSVGAIIGGLMVSVLDPVIGREWSLRAPFLAAAAVQVLLLIYAVPRINTRRITEAESAAGAGSAV